MNKNTAVLPKRIPLTLLAGIFLISLSVLTLEITFTRILSVMLSYHYVFVVISVALLGLGGGGIIAHYTQWSRTEVRSGRLVWLAGFFSLSVPVSVIGITRIPYSSNLYLYSLLILIPFLFAGIILAQVFQIFAHQSGRVYAADLTGAAAGAFLAVPLLDKLGGINSSLSIGLVAAVASLLFATGSIKSKPWLSSVNLILVGGIFWANLMVPNLVDVSVNDNLGKELSASLQDDGLGGGRIIESRWSSFGRTDLVQYPNTPDTMALYTDATAGSNMFRFNGDVRNPGSVVAAMKTGFPGYFPFQFLSPEQKDNALIIGPGGGRDVLLALMAGVGQITAVEVNRDLVDIVKKYSEYNGGIYTNFPNVNMVVAEGRNFLRQQKEEYDLIMLSLAVTKTSRSPEGFALTENFLFTRESIEDYLEHLTSEGRLVVVTHGPQEIMRLLSISFDVLGERGVTDKMDYIYTVGSHANSVFVLSKTKIIPEESYQNHRALHLSSLDPRGSYFPYIKLSFDQNHLERDRFNECQMLNPILTAISGGYISLDEARRAFAESGLDMSVVTDNRPFFYNFEQGIPNSLSSALWLSAVFVLASILVPYSRLRKRRVIQGSIEDKDENNTAKFSGFTLFFPMLGLGFMLVEIPLIQRFILFLGEPTLSISILLFSLLLGAGIGGLTSGRLSWHTLSKKVGLICLGIFLLLLIYAFSVPLILEWLLDLSLPLRVLVSAGLLMPLGFVLGFPFPLGIRLLKESKLDYRIPWVWSINSTTSVLASIVAIIVAMEFGLTQALLVGAVCYFLASLSVWNKIKNTVEKEGTYAIHDYSGSHAGNLSKG